MNICWNSTGFLVFLPYSTHNKSGEIYPFVEYIYRFLIVLSMYCIGFVCVCMCVCVCNIYWLLNTLCVSMRTEMWQGQKKMNYFNVSERKNAILCISIDIRYSVTTHCL